jgi:tetratricopeptide (TPR) repeat protein
MIRRELVAILWLLAMLSCGPAEAEDFAQQRRATYSEFSGALGSPAPWIISGNMAEFSKKALAIFPADTRTGVQALVVGNGLFEYDPKAAYELHKEAVTKLPDEPNVQLEWAMEQHRAGEYAGAAESYSKYLEAEPEFALGWGLLAECLLQTGETDAAVDAWNKAEAATVGTLVELESFVCQVHTRRSLLWARAELLAQAKEGDIDAAERLIAHDCDFEHDWWNRGPHRDFLTNDLQVLRAIEFKDADRVSAIVCAGEAALASESEPEKVATILRDRGLLCDDAHTLPMSNRLLAPLLAAAEVSDAVTRDQARERWGKLIWERAKASQDAELYNVAAHLYLESPELSEIQREGWEATADERFAVARLLQLAAQDQLALDQPDLVKAARLYPNNGIIAQIKLELAEDSKLPLEPLLVQAILAEYSRFMPRGLAMRPNARMLRPYFSRLEKERSEAK